MEVGREEREAVGTFQGRIEQNAKTFSYRRPVDG